MSNVTRRALYALTSGAMITGTTLAAASAAWAGEADVVDVKAVRSGPGLYTFAVTVRSRDTGWDHYADRLDVLGPDGRVLGSRVLEHPHEDEQPFTRDVPDVKVADAARVTVRVHFKPGGFDGATQDVALAGGAR